MVLNPRLYYHILNVNGFVLTQQNAHFIQKYEVVLVDFFHLIPLRNTSKFALVRSADRLLRIVFFSRQISFFEFATHHTRADRLVVVR